MLTLAIRPRILIAWAFVLVLVSALPMDSLNTALAHDTGKSLKTYQGVASGGETVYHFGWHSDTIGYALDLNFGSTADADAGAAVSLDTDASDAVVWAHALNENAYTSCKGVRIETYDNSDNGNYIGMARYVHIDPAAGVPGSGWTIDSGRTFDYLGDIASSENAGCNWEAPHLHQSAGNNSHVYRNTSIPNEGSCNPRCDISNSTWMHEWRF